MKLVSKRRFNVSVESLWEVIREPGNMPAWNHKCVECGCIAEGGVGSRFEVVFQMNNKRKEAEGEVITLKQFEEIRIRYRYKEDNQMGAVDEMFQVSSAGLRKSKLKHVVDFRHSTLPAWVKVLIWFLGVFGRSVGKDPLDGLDDLLVESLA